MNQILIDAMGVLATNLHGLKTKNPLLYLAIQVGLYLFWVASWQVSAGHWLKGADKFVVDLASGFHVAIPLAMGAVQSKTHPFLKKPAVEEASPESENTEKDA